MHAQKRWLFLLFTSATFLFLQIVIDQISVLNGRLQGTVDACYDGRDNHCLHFTASQFNGLYVAHFWAGGVGALFTGFFVGRFGVWVASWTTAGFALVGVFFITLAPYCSTDAGALAMLLIGRMLYAVGYIGNITVSHEVKSHWFMGKELALAFALYITAGKVGGVVTFAAVGAIVEIYGLQIILWITFVAALLGITCAIVAGWIYHKYVSILVDMNLVCYHSHTREFDFSKVNRLGRDLWIVVGIVFFFYSGLFTFMVDGPKFLREICGYDESVAGIITGLIVDIALFAPFLGYLVDKVGGRDIMTCTAVMCFLLAFIIITSAGSMLVILTCVLLGISYAVITASIWSSIPIVTSPDVVGVAMGVSLAVQAFGPGLTVLLAGILLDNMDITLQSRWMRFYVLMLIYAGIAAVLTFVSIYYDGKDGGKRLRLKHTLPALTAVANEDVNECTPLRTDRPITKDSAFTTFVSSDSLVKT